MNKWLNYVTPINNNIVTNGLLLRMLAKFRREVLREDHISPSIMLQLKIRIRKEGYRSISACHYIRKSSFIDLIPDFLLGVEIVNEIYIRDNENIVIEAFELSYKFSSIVLVKDKINRNPRTVTERLPTILIGGFNLPRSMDLSEWGKVHYMNNEQEAIVYKYKSQAVYYVKIEEYKYRVELKYGDRVVLKFTDELLNPGNLTEFKRTVKRHTYYFCDGDIVYHSQTFKKNYIKPIKQVIKINEKFITMDLETKVVEGKLVPYAVSIYDGKESKFFFLSDYKDSYDLLRNALISLMLRKYNGHIVYLHNFSHFDGIFLIRVISDLSNKVKLLKTKQQKIVNVQLFFSEYSINFRDSNLLFNASLDALAKTYNVGEKDIFPYDFINEVSLDYEGEVPDKIYFSKKVSDKNYENYKNRFKSKKWNLKNETELYCVNDAYVLFEVIKVFNLEIFNTFRLNLNRFPTISSLAFGILKSNFLTEDTICILDGTIFDYIQSGYRGGYVEVFKPYGQDITGYEVRSLYPFIMGFTPMPIGQPTAFKGDILRAYPEILHDDSKYLFLKLEVECPSTMEKPFLLHRLRKGQVWHTVAPTGKWTGIYTGVEYRRALELGYKLKIIDGLMFNAKFIFREYVSALYDIKLNSEKGSPRYIIAKLLLNSLYGRFAIDPNLYKHNLISEAQLDEYALNYKIEDIDSLGNGKLLIRYFDEKVVDYKPEYQMMSTSIAISAAITAGARTYMNYFLLNYDVYYTDTDSAYIKGKLDPKFVGDVIGQFKLEGVFDEVVFLAPKVRGSTNSFGEETRVKGLKSPVTFNQLKSLLYKNQSLEINQDKFYGNIGEGSISIKNEIYTVMVTENKRELIFDESGRFVGTKPFHIDETLKNN
uniref:Probable DNA polymerase n=1 Tax=Ganoderma tsugae TaxID=2075311 RepID=A0A2S1WB85_GANTS|nr:DNA-directed RNA polymerase [Ganoderma tsugae]AWJ63857.1 DNA-directed RNA polymerase [Ganoderma tsugae]